MMLGPPSSSGAVRASNMKTDSRNRRSIESIERIGATEEGTLRQHMRTHQGPRDTVYISTLDHEWPRVEESLEGMPSRE